MRSSQEGKGKMDRHGLQTARAWIKSKQSSSFEEMMRSSSSGRLDQSDDVCWSFKDSCSFETWQEEDSQS